MAAIEIGTICVKKFGRGAGEKVTVTAVIDENFVKVKDAKGKEKRANIRHLEPVGK